MSFWVTVIRQVGRNLRQTWGSQLMTLLTVSLSVLIFAFFYLIYTNMLSLGDKLGDDLTLIVYLEEEPGPELQQQLIKKITTFDEVEDIRFISSGMAYERFARQLGQNEDVLDDMPKDFLPPSIEVIPLKNLRSLNQVKLFSAYLAKLPGTLKVQYGQEWVERFYYFTKLLSIVVLLSGTLLILTTIFMVAYTFLLEGLLQGVLGSTIGIAALYTLFHWIKLRFSGPGLLNLFEFSFFSPIVSMSIIGVSILLCTLGSYSTMHKFLRI